MWARISRTPQVPDHGCRIASSLSPTRARLSAPKSSSAWRRRSSFRLMEVRVARQGSPRDRDARSNPADATTRDNLGVLENDDSQHGHDFYRDDYERAVTQSS